MKDLMVKKAHFIHLNHSVKVQVLPPLDLLCLINPCDLNVRQYIFSAVQSVAQGTVDPKSLVYQFLDTLDKRGQVVTNEGDKKGGRKGYQCDQNYNRVG